MCIVITVVCLKIPTFKTKIVCTCKTMIDFMYRELNTKTMCFLYSTL